MVEFKALRVPALTEDVASRLEFLFSQLAGVADYRIVVDSQTLEIRFDELVLDFQTLARELANAGCPLRNMNAALIKELEVS